MPVFGNVFIAEQTFGGQKSRARILEEHSFTDAVLQESKNLRCH